MTKNDNTKEYMKKYHRSPKGRFIIYKTSAKRFNREFNLTFEQFMIFWNLPCYYCDSRIQGIGIDRIDSKQGYTAENCVSCCTFCNKAKMNHSFEYFVDQCVRITNKWKKANKVPLLLK